MELKKSTEANIQSLRLPMILVGLLYITSLTLVSFSYKAPSDDDKKMALNEKDNAGKTEEKKQEEPEPEEEEPEPEPEPEKQEIPPPITEETKVSEDVEIKNQDAIIDDTPLPIEDEEPEVVVVDEIIEFPDVEAEFPGGPAALKKFVLENTKFPDICMDMNAQGRVFVKFCVEKNGSITNITVERNRTGCNDFVKEVKRVLRKMPNWAPGEVGGAPKRTFMRYPFNFTISN